MQKKKKKQYKTKQNKTKQDRLSQKTYKKQIDTQKLIFKTKKRQKVLINLENKAGKKKFGFLYICSNYNIS